MRFYSPYEANSITHPKDVKRLIILSRGQLILFYLTPRRLTLIQTLWPGPVDLGIRGPRGQVGRHPPRFPDFFLDTSERIRFLLFIFFQFFLVWFRAVD